MWVYALFEKAIVLCLSCAHRLLLESYLALVTAVLTACVSPAQALAVIATSPLRVDLSCVLEQVVAELTAFLRKVRNSSLNKLLIILESILLPFLVVLAFAFEVDLPHISENFAP